jgi:hypothetical protein
MYYSGGEGMAFADFDAVPRGIWHTATPRVTVTRGQVSEFCDDTMTDDPHRIGERMKRERSKRFRERNRIAQALKPHSIAAHTPYTFAEVARVCGDDVAGAGRRRVERHNRTVWNTPKPHHLTELPYLATAGDLHARQGVAVSDIATMTPATADDRSDALDRLAVMRRRHVLSTDRRARIGDREPEPLHSALLTVSELAELPPPSWLIDGLVPAGALAELIGPPSTYKSFTAIDMACALATGLPFGSRHRVSEAAAVVYVAGEGSSGMHARIAAWCHHRKIDPDVLDGVLHALPRPVQLHDDDQMAELTAVATETEAKLVVFDTRARSTVGLEENSATEQGTAIANAERLIADTGATVLVVHHTALADPRRARGSSAWFGAVWTSLVQSVLDDRAVIRCAKHKEAKDGCEHPFALENVTPPSGRESLVLTDFDPLALSATGQGSNVAAAILALVRETAGPDGLTAAMMVESARERGLCEKTATRAAVKKLHQAGDLGNVGTVKRPRYVFAEPVEAD